MKIFVYVALMTASAYAFPAPESKSRYARSAEPDLGDLDRFDPAVAARRNTRSWSTSFRETLTGFTGALSDVTESVTDQFSDAVGDATDRILDSLHGPVEIQLADIMTSMSNMVDEISRDMPTEITNRTSKAVRKLFLLGEEYLGRFGYASKNRMKNARLSGLIDITSFSKSIEDFQRMAGLKPTGQLNRDTVRMMSMSRCGVEDTVGAFTMGSTGNMADSKFRNKNQRRRQNRGKKARKTKKRGNKKGSSRTKRYNLEGGRWTKKTLKYAILNYTPDMTRAQVKSSIKRAFNVWANYTTLKFIYTDNENDADLKIAFGALSHGDPYPFDGQGGTLAHAFFPSDGRAHFDEAETFTFKGGPGVNLFIVAAHEFGHSLGLAHSSVPNSLMAPFYQGYVPNFSLHPDDIAAIQQLYGKKVNVDEKKQPPRPTTTTRPRVTKPTKKPRVAAMEVCGKKISFDSMFFDDRRNAMYALKGIYYWKISDSGLVQGYPRKINRYWRGLPGNINAAVYSKVTRKTYFFKGSRMWRYDENRNLDRGFPRPSSDLGLPSNPDAAMQWGSDGMIYVFKREHFYHVSEYQPYDGIARYPKSSISMYWDGVPSSPDGAIQWKNGKTYFFKGDNYWRFSGQDKTMDVHYPKSVKKFWLGCKQNTNPSARLQKKNKKNKSKKQGKKSRRTDGRRDRARNTNEGSNRGPILGRLTAPNTSTGH